MALAGATIRHVAAGPAYAPGGIGNGTGPAPSDIATLITTLGGNAAVNGFYDCRTGLTIVGGSQVSTWADARGGGFGPSLTQGTGSKRPTVNAQGALQTVASAGQCLLSAANALWRANGNISMIYVGAITGGSSGLYGAAIADANSPTTFLGIDGGGAIYSAKGGGVIVQASSTIVADARIRCVVAWIAGTTPVTCQVPTQGTHSTTIATANSATNPTLCLGGYFGGNGNSNGTHRAIIVMPSVISGGNITAVLNWAIANHAAISGATA
jgi:hypothetical protein